MKRGYIIFIIGTLVGMILHQYVLKTPTSIIIYLLTFIWVFMLSSEKVTEVFGFFLYSTLLIYYPITWMNGDFRWYEPLIFLLLVYVLFGSVFKNMERPITVDVNDVLRFPPQDKDVLV